MIVQMSLMNRALDESAEGITITDYTKPDNFIIYVNAGFERLTRYAVDKIIGKNCRFLQGLGTDQKVLDEIRQGIKEERPVTVELLNYRKDVTQFWNRLAIAPARNEVGITTHFIGIQSDITKRKKAEDALFHANQ
jgi:PAS domain S-box-containing protein